MSILTDKLRERCQGERRKPPNATEDSMFPSGGRTEEINVIQLQVACADPSLGLETTRALGRGALSHLLGGLAGGLGRGSGARGLAVHVTWGSCLPRFPHLNQEAKSRPPAEAVLVSVTMLSGQQDPKAPARPGTSPRPWASLTPANFGKCRGVRGGHMGGSAATVATVASARERQSQTV